MLNYFKELLEPNMEEKSIVARRVIKDHLITFDLKSHEVPIHQELKRSVRSARVRYQLYLEDKQKEEEAKSKRKKSSINKNRVKVLEEEKARHKELNAALMRDSHKTFMEASSAVKDPAKVSLLLAKGSALSNRAEDVLKEVEALQKEIADIQSE